MERKFSGIISVVFHPLLCATYTMALMFFIRTIFNSTVTLYGKFLVMGFVFVTTFVFPLILILILLRKGTVKTLQMETREERILPFLLTSIFYYSTYYVLRQIHLPQMFQMFILGSTFLIAISLLINFWWKISVHMVAIGGMTGTITGLSFQLDYDMRVLIALLFIVAGLVGYARLKLEAHKPLQVYGGFVLGLALMLVLFIRF